MRLEAGQWVTWVPLRATSAMPGFVSQTQWASTSHGPVSPISAKYSRSPRPISARTTVSSSSCSEAWVWTRAPRFARSTTASISSALHERMKRGV